ncbi:CKLF-like MARVEL transmembrane domain-containing protein 3 [Neoarius graeffei]|uniref:CKLF-like MARVEL transmembrane domain-containing protein 3 n=1 Tax=Neoarius graeffei TaxID=443677 RepID=UPI00298C1482|nr:CKLF-like MARVEL transmembrane domain-containing protein 3 [Neoarius graeffei]
MGDMESPAGTESRAAAVFSLLMTKELIGCRKGQLLLAEVISSFISFVCFCASTAAAFVTAPLLAFISALLILFAHAVKFHQRFTGFHWPLMDFLRCITASIVFFIISIMAVSKYPDGSSKAAGVFGFIATIVFALDFYFIFNELADFLKGGGSHEEPQNKHDADSDSDSD